MDHKDEHEEDFEYAKKLQSQFDEERVNLSTTSASNLVTPGIQETNLHGKVNDIYNQLHKELKKGSKNKKMAKSNSSDIELAVTNTSQRMNRNDTKNNGFFQKTKHSLFSTEVSTTVKLLCAANTFVCILIICIFIKSI